MPYKSIEDQRAWARRYRAANPEKIKELNSRHKEKHREELLEYQRTWTRNNKERLKGYEKRRKERDPAKFSARQMVNLAVKYGGMPKPTVCSECGLPAKPIHAHHHAGYDYLNWLNIIWLCPPCHREEHAKIKSQISLPI